MSDATLDKLRSLGYASAGDADMELPDPLDASQLSSPRERMGELKLTNEAALIGREGDRPEAIVRLRAIVEENPLNVYALEILSGFLVEESEFAEAIARIATRAATLGAALLLLPWSAAPAGLEVHLLDVGHGSSVVLRAPGIEALIFDYLARQTDYKFTSITSVDCSEHECEIVFTGVNANPENIGEFSGLNSKMFLPPISVATSTFFTREIVAGAREYVIRISNIPWEGRDEEPQEEN